MRQIEWGFDTGDSGSKGRNRNLLASGEGLQEPGISARMCHVVAGLTPESQGSQHFGYHASNPSSSTWISLAEFLKNVERRGEI